MFCVREIIAYAGCGAAYEAQNKPSDADAKAAQSADKKPDAVRMPRRCASARRGQNK
ncbi:MAG: hypothetical protein IKS90_04860 [Clostridia bacterium]|nr:hypothetical protein [Clostridia bacterium]